MRTVEVLKCTACGTSAAILNETDGCSRCGCKQFLLLEVVPYKGTVINETKINFSIEN